VPPRAVLDTLSLFRRWFPDAPGHSLEALSVYCGLPAGRSHRAEADASTVFKLFCCGMEQQPVQTLETVRQDAGLILLNGKKN
jgi:DNA polymerase III epsilon subunit-like protein